MRVWIAAGNSGEMTDGSAVVRCCEGALGFDALEQEGGGFGREAGCRVSGFADVGLLQTTKSDRLAHSKKPPEAGLRQDYRPDKLLVDEGESC